MRITRRTLLGTSLAASLAPRLALGADAPLRAQVAQVRLAPEGYPATDLWTYDGGVPGPAIRVPQGGRLSRLLVNDLPQPTTIHWHGIRLPNAMDGVPGMTQAPVAPGESFAYDFAAPDAGTYWYHSHFRSLEQVARGLSGPLIVTEAEGAPEVDRDEVIHLSDWRLSDTAAIADDFGHPHDLSHAGRLGNFVTANGQSELRYQARQGERFRLRLINAAPARIFELRLQGLSGWVVAVDGMPLDAPTAIGQIFVGPGQRVDMLVDVTADPGDEAFLLEIDRGEGFSLASFAVAPGGGTPRRPAPAALPANPGQTPLGLSDARPVPLAMDGGAMRGLSQAVWKGRTLDGRSLAMEGQFWAFNGIVGMGDAPLIEAAIGETLRIPIANRTAFPHAMHLHGHHFRELRADGSLGLWRDTILIDPGQTREIVFLADNPGDWMFHCHMLSHHAAGMGTWIRVV
ncbi:multicopper oxidase family protein [Halovulum dunhuangense]|uniref:Multicopper oxidase family protein n=1 Tax=Halovulum dunhuangense TaxID=1505036 RepID=A0A849L3K9_9RHOB|nr:multicopper oxidase family protein [Halovulum dunhuangense]NNU80905.1 multicopper oxidase family protein [Halovulum dunhuangense]